MLARRLFLSRDFAHWAGQAPFYLQSGQCRTPVHVAVAKAVLLDLPNNKTVISVGIQPETAEIFVHLVYLQTPRQTIQKLLLLGDSNRSQVLEEVFLSCRTLMKDGQKLCRKLVCTFFDVCPEGKLGTSWKVKDKDLAKMGDEVISTNASRDRLLRFAESGRCVELSTLKEAQQWTVQGRNAGSFIIVKDRGMSKITVLYSGTLFSLGVEGILGEEKLLNFSELLDFLQLKIANLVVSAENW
jgi:hypothetical protein